MMLSVVGVLKIPKLLQPTSTQFIFSANANLMLREIALAVLKDL